MTFILLFCIFSSVGAELFEAFQIKKEHLNKRLVGHKISEIAINGYHECVRECFYLSLCKSTDYYKGECQLNDVDSESVGMTDFENKPGAVYSDITEWPSGMAGMCGQRPCSKQQKCIPDKDSFHCSDILTDCKSILQYFPSSQSGVYEIKLWQSLQLLTVYCDMDVDGGGWTVFQSRFNGSVDFYRNFSEYESGFGSLDTEFWLGLKYVQEMASQGRSELRVDLTAADGTTGYDTFHSFYLDKGSKYTLHIEEGTGTGGQGLLYHNGRHFSTYDADRDVSDKHCAEKDHGGWWYKSCANANLNGEYVTPGTERPDRAEAGMVYKSFKGTESLKASKMMFRRVYT